MTFLRRSFSSLVALPLLVASLASPVGAATSAEDEASAPRVRVNGDAELLVAPDEARLQVAVTTEDRRSRNAADSNAKKAQAVIKALQGIAGRDGEVRTLGYSLSPQYDYPKNGERQLRGYLATNTIELRTRDLDRVGDAIDAATTAGANQVNRLEFGLRDDLAARSEALRQATLRAQAKARAVAGALGLEIARVVRLDEGGGVVVIQRRAEMRAHTSAMQAEADTPVEAGSIEVRAEVTLEVELSR